MRFLKKALPVLVSLFALKLAEKADEKDAPKWLKKSVIIFMTILNTFVAGLLFYYCFFAYEEEIQKRAISALLAIFVAWNTILKLKEYFDKK